MLFAYKETFTLLLPSINHTMTRHDECITVDGLTKSYNGVKAVDGISFSVKRGTVFGFLGPNGAGKSTTIKMLTTLIQPDGGSASVLGFDVSKEPLNVRCKIGIVQQQPSYEPTLTVEKALDRYGMMWGVPTTVRKRRIEKLLQDFDLVKFRKKRNQDLSIGQRRRVQVAREFIHDMELLFLDEPTVGMDPAARRKLLNYLKDKARTGLTIFYTTHVLSEVEYLCDNVMILYNGKIVASGTPEALKRKFDSKKSVILRTDGNTTEIKDLLKGIPDCQVENNDGTRITVESNRHVDVLTDILTRLRKDGFHVYELHSVESSLEDVFLDVVKQ